MFVIIFLLNHTLPHCGRSAFFEVTIDPLFVANALHDSTVQWWNIPDHVRVATGCDARLILKESSLAYHLPDKIVAPHELLPSSLINSSCICRSRQICYTVWLEFIEATELRSNPAVCAWLCWALLIAQSSLGLSSYLHNGNLCPALLQQ